MKRASYRDAVAVIATKHSPGDLRFYGSPDRSWMDEVAELWYFSTNDEKPVELGRRECRGQVSAEWRATGASTGRTC